MIQTFEIERGRLRYEVAVFSDGSVAARRHNPEERELDWTDTFDGVSSAEEELGIRIPKPAPPSDAAVRLCCRFNLPAWLCDTILRQCANNSEEAAAAFIVASGGRDTERSVARYEREPDE